MDNGTVSAGRAHWLTPVPIEKNKHIPGYTPRTIRETGIGPAMSIQRADHISLCELDLSVRGKK